MWVGIKPRLLDLVTCAFTHSATSWSVCLFLFLPSFLLIRFIYLYVYAWVPTYMYVHHMWAVLEIMWDVNRSSVEQQVLLTTLQPSGQSRVHMDATAGLPRVPTLGTLWRLVAHTQTSQRQLCLDRWGDVCVKTLPLFLELFPKLFSGLPHLILQSSWLVRGLGSLVLYVTLLLFLWLKTLEM